MAWRVGWGGAVHEEDEEPLGARWGEAGFNYRAAGLRPYLSPWLNRQVAVAQ